MPSAFYDFPGLVADNTGTIRGTKTDRQNATLVLDRVTVQSRTGCSGRNHPVTAQLQGGVTFGYTGSLVDCQQLDVQLGGLMLPANTDATISFEARGFTPGERVDLHGILHASHPSEGASISVPKPVATIVTGLSNMATLPMGAFTTMMGELSQQMPIIGDEGVFSTMREDFLAMTTAIRELTIEIRKNNESRGPH